MLARPRSVLQLEADGRELGRRERDLGLIEPGLRELHWLEVQLRLGGGDLDAMLVEPHAPRVGDAKPASVQHALQALSDRNILLLSCGIRQRVASRGDTRGLIALGKRSRVSGAHWGIIESRSARYQNGGPKAVPHAGPSLFRRSGIRRRCLLSAT